MGSDSQKPLIPVTRPWAGDNDTVQQGPSPITPTGRPMLNVFVAQPIRQDPFNTINAFLPLDTQNSDFSTANSTSTTLSSTGATSGSSGSRWLVDAADDFISSSEPVGLYGDVNNYQEIQEAHRSDFLVGIGGAFPDIIPEDARIADFEEDIDLILDPRHGTGRDGGLAAGSSTPEDIIEVNDQD